MASSNAANGNAAKQPRLRDLGRDLLRISRGRCLFVLLAPFLCAAAYFCCARSDLWPAAILSLAALSFATYGSTSHELVHRNLRLPHWLNESLLCIIELLALRSGHAYRAAHLRHHARFPEPDDIEGTASRQSLVGTLLVGTALQFRIWIWALRQDARARAWIIAEGLMCAGIIASAFAFSDLTPVLLPYVGLVLAGHALLPVVTVYLVHDRDGADELSQTRAFRGTGYAVLALQHLYHLEHHLYPRVPHPNWPELARRLEPFLRDVGVHFHRIGG